jgi:hypothetical protein
MTRIFAVALLALAFAAQGVTCPIDDSGAYFTGRTQTDESTGKLMKQYECRRAGHRFWVVNK